MREPNRYRTIWLSDFHLATRGCKAGFLLDFLKHNDSDILYLVGDIFDGWRMRRSFFWIQSHNDVIQKILRKARKGTQVVYIPGNHDEGFRQYVDMEFGGVRILNEAVHVAADGKRFLVIHGDEYDGIVKYSRWLALFGESAYNLAIVVNHHFNRIRRKLGYPYWSLSCFLKDKVKNAMEFIADFKHTLIGEVTKKGFDGIVCGHIHRAEIERIDGKLYCNTGDWIESCTALVEHQDGRLEIIRWAETRQLDYQEVNW